MSVAAVRAWARVILATTAALGILAFASDASLAFGFVAVSAVGRSVLPDTALPPLIEATVTTAGGVLCAVGFRRWLAPSLGAWGAGFFVGLTLVALVGSLGFEGFGFALGSLGGLAEPIHEYALALLPTPLPLVLAGVFFVLLHRRAVQSTDVS